MQTPRQRLMLLVSALLFCIAVTPRLGTAEAEKSIIPASTSSTIAAPTTITSTASTTTAVAVVISTTTTLPSYLTISDPCRYDNTHRHTIVQGDTLWDLSQRYHVNMVDIIRCNYWIEGPDHLLLVGDKVILPPKAWETPPSTTTTTIPIITSPPTTKPAPPPPVSTAISIAVVTGNRATHPQCPWEDEIRAAFASNGASVSTQDFFVAVAWRESGCKHLSHNPNAATRDDSYGLFQINMRRDALGPLMNSWGYTGSSLLNGYINIEATVRLWKYCGKGPWIRPYSCSYN